MSVNRSAYYEEVDAERERQVVKWGTEQDLAAILGNANLYLLSKLCILGEEYGEACMACNDGKLHDLREEMVQVAAVAIATLEGIDEVLKWQDYARRVGSRQ